MHPVGAENCVTSCDLGVFVDQAAEPVASEDPRARCGSGRTRPPGGRVLVQRPVRPMRVVVIDVLVEDQLEMPFADGQHPVQALAACAGDPAFRDGVRPRRLDRCLHDPHADGGEHRVEGSPSTLRASKTLPPRCGCGRKAC
jgi:hypothetical protein